MLFATASLLLLSSLHTVVAETHRIVVGGPGKLLFDPEAIFAAPGDLVQFEFRQKNHTATQSSFAAPCSAHQGGFDSGFHPVGDDVTEGFPVVEYTVQDANPVWIHCAQTGHCGRGMVFAINCGPDGATNSFTNFKNAALAIGAAASSSAAASSTAAASSSAAAGSGSPYVYPSTTIAADPYAPTVTATVTLSSSTWVTTYTSAPGSADPTPGSLDGEEIHVTVGGNNGLTYDPPYVTAKPRDTIVFHFASKNHTVTQSSFGAPCRKLETTSQTGAIGFDSGFFPVAANTTDFPTFRLKVNDTNPVWAYCRQGNHCGAGMVFGINVDETGDRSYEAFVTLAKSLNGTSAQSNSNTTGTGTETGTNAASHSVAVNGIAGLAALALLFSQL